MTTSIPLRRAYVKFARKQLGFRALRAGVKLNQVTRNYDKTIVAAGVHTLPRCASIVRIGPDEIAVTDGGYGYTAFRLSELQKMLREAKKLPIATEFRTDVTP